LGRRSQQKGRSEKTADLSETLPAPHAGEVVVAKNKLSPGFSLSGTLFVSTIGLYSGCVIALSTPALSRFVESLRNRYE
jgi:hypothetical protein